MPPLRPPQPATPPLMRPPQPAIPPLMLQQYKYNNAQLIKMPAKKIVLHIRFTQVGELFLWAGTGFAIGQLLTKLYPRRQNPSGILGRSP